MKGKKLARLVGSLCLIVAVVLGVFLALNLGEDDSIFSKEEKPNKLTESSLTAIYV